MGAVVCERSILAVQHYISIVVACVVTIETAVADRNRPMNLCICIWNHGCVSVRAGMPNIWVILLPQ